MLSDSDKWLLNQLADALERKIRRDWAVADHTMGLDAAVRKTAEVLAEQWRKPLDPSAQGHQFLVGLIMLEKYFTAIPPPDDELELAILKSAEDHSAFQALRFLVVAGLAGKFEALDLWNRRVMAGSLREPLIPRGPSQATNLWRDHLICSQIKALKDEGFAVFRNSATPEKSSACDIVAKATHLLGDGRGMTYAAVEGIWKRQPKLMRPEIIAEAMLRPLLNAFSGPPKTEK
jgi:hypothetical protein